MGRGAELFCLGTAARGRLAAAAPTFGSEADILGQGATRFGIVGRDHRIVLGEVPLRAILVGGHVIGSHQMAAEHLEFLAVFQTHDVIGFHRRSNREGGLLFDFRSLERTKTGKGYITRPRSADLSEGTKCVSTWITRWWSKH